MFAKGKWRVMYLEEVVNRLKERRIEEGDCMREKRKNVFEATMKERQRR